MIKKTLTTLLAITAMFGLAQFAAAQTAERNLSPVESIEKLIEMTLPAHPWVFVEKPWASKSVDETHRQKQVKMLDDALAVNRDLTPAQKSFVKAHYDELRETVSVQIVIAAEELFTFEFWADENLMQRFTDKLTAAEVNGLIAYFQGKAGQKSLKVLKTAGKSEENEKNGGARLFTKEEETEAQRFSETAVGEKFMDAFLGNAKEDLDARMEEAGKSGGNKVRAVTEPINLNKIFNQYVKDNYKK